MRPASTVLAGIVLSAVLCGCGGSAAENESAPAEARAQPAVRDLASLAPLKRAFDADAGKPRLVLILSPT